MGYGAGTCRPEIPQGRSAGFWSAQGVLPHGAPPTPPTPMPHGIWHRTHEQPSAMSTRFVCRVMSAGWWVVSVGVSWGLSGVGWAFPDGRPNKGHSEWGAPREILQGGGRATAGAGGQAGRQAVAKKWQNLEKKNWPKIPDRCTFIGFF